MWYAATAAQTIRDMIPWKKQSRNGIGRVKLKIRKKGTEPRNTVLTIRLSNTEKEELKKRASSAGLSMGAFLIETALKNKDPGE